MSYEKFIQAKVSAAMPDGLDDVPPLNPALFQFQADCVTWALRRGRAALFEDCGLGKTLQQLEWARCVGVATQGDVLILAPLAVAAQTQREAERFGIRARVSRDGDAAAGVTITNYERLHRFDPSRFAGVVLDESSILKSYDGATRAEITDAFKTTRFRLACSATPSPNDHVELGNHSEFLGVLSRVEMMATYFKHDSGDTSKWRLKGHAEADFWKWVASWAVMLRRPSDLAYSDDGFVLPPLHIVEHIMESGVPPEGMLFVQPALTLDEQRRARRATLAMRVARVAEMVNGSRDPWLVWCELNDEGDALARAIPDAVQVSGADDDDAKASKMMAFTSGAARVLVSKPTICGFGMNWQHCAHEAFVGPSHSFEQFYQAVRRCWRFGQQRAVNVHVVTTDIEVAVLDNIKRKQADADRMAIEMVRNMSEITTAAIHGSTHQTDNYKPRVKSALPSWM